jgi:uncharacterized membrane protein
MASRASIARHPIHPALVALPIGTFVFAFICDVAYHAGAHAPFWKDAAFYSMAVGVIGALVAAVPGFIDYATIVDRRVRSIATTHMVLNLTVVVLYAVSLWMRTRRLPEDTMPVWVSVAGLVLLSVAGFLGGELVFKHGMAVGPERTATTIDVAPGTARPARSDDVRRGA